MITHIVMWKLNREAQSSELLRANALEMKAALEALPALISDIQFFQVGIDVLQTVSSYDVVLVSRFDSLAALERYQQHPEHMRVGTFIKRVVSDRKVVDFET